MREVPGGYLVFCKQTAQTPPARTHIFIRKIGLAGEFLHETEYGDHPTAEYEMGYMDPIARDPEGLHVMTFHDGWNYGDTVYLARFDDEGVMVDRHFLYAYPAQDSITAYIRQVRGTSDGGFVLGGVWGIAGTTNAMAFVVRTDASGDTLWTEHYGVDPPVHSYHYCLGVEEYTDGGFLVVGYRSGGGGWAGTF